LHFFVISFVAEMKTSHLFKKLFFWFAYHWCELQSHPIPEHSRLKHCKIISHRGEHDNCNIFENTLEAFDIVKEHGVWGIEFDVRWTKDLQPVVVHDKDTQRLFGKKIKICEITQSELNSYFPLIPSLEEVIQRYGKKLHLMVEIKEEAYPDTVYQKQVLADIFSTLEPLKDFHLISFSPEMFELINFVPTATFLLIAKLNCRKLSELAIQKDYGGILGHYFLLKDELLSEHHKRGQHTGTGFIASKNCLCRELNRKVEWIFSNHATQIQSLCYSLLKKR
jgi:glycerophosphoryl diester phosphodiesterase